MTIVQSSGIKHPKLPFQWGAGTLSVMGVSFTTVPIAQAIVPVLMTEYKTTISKQQCDFNYGFFTVGSQAGGSPCACTAMPASGMCPTNYTAAEAMPSWLPLYNYPSTLAGTCCPAVGTTVFGYDHCLINCTNQAFDYGAPRPQSLYIYLVIPNATAQPRTPSRPPPRPCCRRWRRCCLCPPTVNEGRAARSHAVSSSVRQRAKHRPACAFGVC